MLSLEASLSAVHKERSQSDMGLKSRMQELLSELQSTLQVCLPPCLDLVRVHGLLSGEKSAFASANVLYAQFSLTSQHSLA